MNFGAYDYSRRHRVAVRHWHKLSRSTKGTQSQKSDYNLFQDLPNVDRLTSQVAFHVYIESFVFPVSKDTLQFIYLYKIYQSSTDSEISSQVDLPCEMTER